MSDKLEAYLEEIGHYLAVAEGREEILSEIRSHILEKAERESGGVSAASLDAVIAAYGPPRRVAEKYLDGQEIIAPAYKRYLFRYTGLLFAAHLFLTLVAVLFNTNFVFFPFLFMPKMGPFEAVLYLPTALLADFGLVTLILHLITRSRKDIKLPWPKFAVDIDEVKPRKGLIPAVLGFLVLLALTAAALFLYLKYGTIFLRKFDPSDFRPLLSPDAGRFYSLAVISPLGARLRRTTRQDLPRVRMDQPRPERAVARRSGHRPRPSDRRRTPRRPRNGTLRSLVPDQSDRDVGIIAVSPPSRSSRASSSSGGGGWRDDRDRAEQS